MTKLPSSIPIPTPTVQPTFTPAPTSRPTSQPTIRPTSAPTASPTSLPTIQPTPSPTPFVDITPSPTVPFVNNFLGVWKYNTTYSYVFDNGYRWFFYNGSTLLNYGTYQLIGSTICNITITNKMNTNDAEEWGIPKRMSCLYQSFPKTITNTYILQLLTYDSINNPYPTPPVPTEPPSGLPTVPPVPTTVPPIPPLTPPPVVISTLPPNLPSGVKSDGFSCYEGHDGPSCNDLVCLNGGSTIYSNPTINDTGPYCSCLGNYDPATNCAVCSGNYDLATNCLNCINTNFDITTNCSTCISGHSGKNCSAINCSGYSIADITDLTSTNGTCICPIGSNLDITTNCSTCISGHSGKNCSAINCSGYSIADITDLTSTNGTCICPIGSNLDITTNCSTCISGYGGQNCSTNCLNGGTYISNPNSSLVCSCRVNFDPTTNCATCLPGYGGPNCTITCPNGGTANSNPNASTACSCRVNFDPTTNCATCLPGYGGPNCTITCQNGGTANSNPNASTVCSCIGEFNPSTNCNSIICLNGTLSNNGLTCNCKQGWVKDSNGHCTLCAPGYGGPNCTYGYCGINGITPDTINSPNPSCVCKTGWATNPNNTSEPCTWCAPGYAGPNCTTDYCGGGSPIYGNYPDTSVAQPVVLGSAYRDYISFGYYYQYYTYNELSLQPTVINNPNGNSCNCFPSMIPDYTKTNNVCYGTAAPGFTTNSYGHTFSDACFASFSTTTPCTGKCWNGYAINPSTGKCEWCAADYNAYTKDYNYSGDSGKICAPSLLSCNSHAVYPDIFDRGYAKKVPHAPNDVCVCNSGYNQVDPVLTKCS